MMLREQLALHLLTDADAATLSHCDDLEAICLTDDNGGAPDGDAWLMWHTDGDPVDDDELATAQAAGIGCERVTIWVCDYPRESWHPDQYMTIPLDSLSGWMGHQTSGQIAFLDERQAREFRDRWELADQLADAVASHEQAS